MLCLFASVCSIAPPLTIGSSCISPLSLPFFLVRMLPLTPYVIVLFKHKIPKCLLVYAVSGVVIAPHFVIKHLVYVRLAPAALAPFVDIINFERRGCIFLSYMYLLVAPRAIVWFTCFNLMRWRNFNHGYHAPPLSRNKDNIQKVVRLYSHELGSCPTFQQGYRPTRHHSWNMNNNRPLHIQCRVY